LTRIPFVYKKRIKFANRVIKHGTTIKERMIKNVSSMRPKEVSGNVGHYVKEGATEIWKGKSE